MIDCEDKIFKLLERSNRPLTAKELALLTGYSKIRVENILKGFIERGKIERI